VSNAFTPAVEHQLRLMDPTDERAQLAKRYAAMVTEAYSNACPCCASDVLTFWVITGGNPSPRIARNGAWLDGKEDVAASVAVSKPTRESEVVAAILAQLDEEAA
jgi:hypothetical protein